MSRASGDVVVNGIVVDGFDYDLQVWVVAGVIARCGHPERMGPSCCNQRVLAGRKIEDVEGHEVRS